MKKILVSILAIFYLTSVVGTTVHLHYCMNKLINWSLTKSDGDKCDKCGMKKDGGCCKDEHKLVKNNVDQNTTESAAQFMQPLPALAPSAFINSSEDYSSTLIEEFSICHAPPLIKTSEIYILNCVFRI